MIVIVMLSRWVGRNFRVSEIYLLTAISHRGKRQHYKRCIFAFSNSSVSL